MPIIKFRHSFVIVDTVPMTAESLAIIIFVIVVIVVIVNKYIINKKQTNKHTFHVVVSVGYN